MLLRVQLPDRPGSLGAVATALGSVGADILAIEIVEKGEGAAIDDFMVDLPPTMQPDSLVSACTALPGCHVLYVSRHQETWGIESDIVTLNRMSAEPARDAEVLLEAAPTVFHSQWAALIEATGPSVIMSTALAPEFDSDGLAMLAPFAAAHRLELPTGWVDSWPADHRRGRAAGAGPGDRRRPSRRAAVPRLRDQPPRAPRSAGALRRPRVVRAAPCRRSSRAHR